MEMKLTLLQKLAFRTSLISIFVLLIFTLAVYFFLEVNLINLLLILLVYFFGLYLIIHRHIRNFIFQQLRKVYDTALFDNEPFLKNDSDDIDFENFIDRVKKFAENKHDEIEQLHNRDDFRRDFIGDVSHELKTPLFTAQGYLLTVLDDDLDDPELIKKYLQRTNKSIERLTYIVKDLDMIAKLESGMRLEQDTFNIVKMLRDVIELFELKASKKSIHIEFKEPYEFPIMVRADKDKIEQVVINLLSNSIKYGKVQGRTIVSIESHSPYQYIINFEDDGLGIEEDDIPRLFERFYRVEKSRSRDQGGSGLGLAIVKHIIEAHKQEVFVESTKDHGSTFSFTLNKAI